jgi:AcrR family transcriptional regulator
MSIARTRLSPEASRLAAIDAARTILIEEGPQALTLKAVAARIGRTHANLLHHFGSAAELHRALIEAMAEQITARIGAEVIRMRSGEVSARAVVDLTFDAFAHEGAGALASWMILSGNRDALTPVFEAIHRLVDELGDYNGRSLATTTLALVLSALGDALLGAPLADALGLPRSTARELAHDQMLALEAVPPQA